MKKIYLFIGVMIVTHIAVCQPTFTAANFNPLLGETLSGFGFDTTSFTLGTTGAGVTWNYSGLVSTGATTPVTLVAPSTTTYAASFPAANAAYGTGGAYDYYLYNSTGQYQSGEGSTSQVVSEYDMGTMYTFPFTYGFSSTDSLHANFMASTYPATRKGRIVTNADGYGTLQLPTGTYTNVMRVKLIWTMDETIDYGVTTMTATYIFKYYYWIKPNTHFPLLTYLQTGIVSGGFPIWVSSGTYIDPALVDVSEETQNETQFALFPNPSVNREVQLVMNSANAQPMTIHICNTAGQIIFQKAINVIGGFNNIALDLNGIEKGIYFVDVYNLSGKTTNKIILE